MLGDTGNSELHPFSFFINAFPEPAASGLAGVGLLGLAAFRRRRPCDVVVPEKHR